MPSDFWIFLQENFETVLKAIAPLVVAVVAYLQRGFFVRPRAKLKTDLEMLGLLQEKDLQFELEKVKSNVASQVKNIYGTPSAERNSVKLAIFGAIWTLVFSYITVSIYQKNGWEHWYWLALSGFLTLSGIGWVSIGLERKVRKSIRATKVVVDDEFITTTLNDDRRISVPLEWYSELASSSPEIRQKVEITDGGQTLLWDDIHIRVSVEWILSGERLLLRGAR